MSLGLNEKPQSYDEPAAGPTIRIEFGSIFWPVVAAFFACSLAGAVLWWILTAMR